jgi:hypothetical protein
MIAGRNESQSLLGAAQRGVFGHDLFTDPSWVSPLLLPLVLIWLIGSVRQGRVAITAGALLAAAVVAPPFFAVSACSSDAVRYQGALLGLVTSFAVAGLWHVPFSSWIGNGGSAVVRTALLAALAVLPLSSMRQPEDPMVVEQRLIEEAIRRMQPGTLVILPEGRFAGDEIIPEFPDFLLPEGSRMVFAGDPRIASHAGPELLYLGLACISWERAQSGGGAGEEPVDLRPECQALRGDAQPWLVRTLRSDELPRSHDGTVWTFHHLTPGVPFGFFAPQSR